MSLALRAVALSHLRQTLGGNSLLPAIGGGGDALLGTVVGYKTRHGLVLRAHIPDLTVAIAEDLNCGCRKLTDCCARLERLPGCVYLPPTA